MSFSWACIEFSTSSTGTFVRDFRFFNWENVIMTSFVAGLLQSVLYADFIYYFVKSNQNDKNMSFPV